MLFCCLQRNVEPSCHKHFVVVSRHQQTPLLTSNECHNLPRSVTAECIALGTQSIHSTRWSKILPQNRDFCLPHLHSMPHWGGGSRRNIAMPFGMEKLEWFGYPTVKILRYVYSFWQNLRTWRTDGQTPHDGIGRTHLHSTAGQKLWMR